MTRVFSGIKPTGPIHLGNLLGALRNWVEDQDEHDSIYCVVDLHALTVPQDPSLLRSRTLEMAQLLIAVGLDPQRCTLFVQSHIHQHSELSWILECTAAFGELRRMTQFKDKSGKEDFVSAGLFTYPALMAADILLYDTDRVPVGDDQRQHLELARDLALRFNHRFGDTFVVPEASIPKVGRARNGSSGPDSENVCVRRYCCWPNPAPGRPWCRGQKIKKAVTDTDTEVRFDPTDKPGVSNLLSILGACTNEDPSKLAERYDQYGPLKSDTADAVCSILEPIQRRFQELSSDPGSTADALKTGAEKASMRAEATMSSGSLCARIIGAFTLRPWRTCSAIRHTRLLESGRD